MYNNFIQTIFTYYSSIEKKMLLYIRKLLVLVHVFVKICYYKNILDPPMLLVLWQNVSIDMAQLKTVHIYIYIYMTPHSHYNINNIALHSRLKYWKKLCVYIYDFFSNIKLRLIGKSKITVKYLYKENCDWHSTTKTANYT